MLNVYCYYKWYKLIMTCAWYLMIFLCPHGTVIKYYAQNTIDYLAGNVVILNAPINSPK